MQTYVYDAFGNIVNETGTLNNSYTYTGREWDKEAGLYYYRTRYYDPNAGRFITEDPISFAGGDVNFYAYVQNNPVNLIDPLGLCTDKNINENNTGYNRMKERLEALGYVEFKSPVNVGNMAHHYSYSNIVFNPYDTVEFLKLDENGQGSDEIIIDGKTGGIITGRQGGSYNVYDPRKYPLEHFHVDMLNLNISVSDDAIYSSTPWGYQLR